MSCSSLSSYNTTQESESMNTKIGNESSDTSIDNDYVDWWPEDPAYEMVGKQIEAALIEYKKSKYPANYKLEIQLTANNNSKPVLKCRVRQHSETETADWPSATSIGVSDDNVKQSQCRKETLRGMHNRTMDQSSMDFQQSPDDSASNSLYHQLSKFFGQIFDVFRR